MALLSWSEKKSKLIIGIIIIIEYVLSKNWFELFWPKLCPYFLLVKNLFSILHIAAGVDILEAIILRLFYIICLLVFAIHSEFII